ncbi:MAG TPA: quinone-dependent dihydroorotate dehydrogenase [Pyrinomonadaceae bacterium]|jgi:dihydroorotate dehydrogenase
MLYSKILRPLLFRLPPEQAHELALKSLSAALGTEWARAFVAGRLSREPFGRLQRFGLSFSNPVGLAAGFDKNGTAAESLSALGFGFIEVGTVTHLPQEGNQRPRLFRLPLDQALINRLGFNNVGAAKVAARLATQRPGCVLGINIGKSRAVALEDAIPDYLHSFELVHQVADYVAINVSSPNTPNLRELQHPDALAELLDELQKKNRALAQAAQGRQPLPLLVKIAPDLETRELEELARVAIKAQLSGIIATNTTTSRAQLKTRVAEVAACGAGGLSGAPLRARSTKIVAELYKLTRGEMAIIGVGGIFNALDAWEKICAGASLVQLYTGFIYEGVSIARKINDGLAELLLKEGFGSLDEAVGCRAAELAFASA